MQPAEEGEGEEEDEEQGDRDMGAATERTLEEAALRGRRLYATDRSVRRRVETDDVDYIDVRNYCECLQSDGSDQLCAFA